MRRPRYLFSVTALAVLASLAGPLAVRAEDQHEKSHVYHIGSSAYFANNTVKTIWSGESFNMCGSVFDVELGTKYDFYNGNRMHIISVKAIYRLARGSNWVAGGPLQFNGDFASGNDKN